MSTLHILYAGMILLIVLNIVFAGRYRNMALRLNSARDHQASTQVKALEIRQEKIELRRELGKLREEINGWIASGLPRYKCHKIVSAKPMTRGAYNTFRGWTIPSDENPGDPGFLVVYGEGTPDEYVSWSPQKQFRVGYSLLS